MIELNVTDLDQHTFLWDLKRIRNMVLGLQPTIINIIDYSNI